MRIGTKILQEFEQGNRGKWRRQQGRSNESGSSSCLGEHESTNAQNLRLHCVSSEVTLSASSGRTKEAAVCSHSVSMRTVWWGDEQQPPSPLADQSRLTGHFGFRAFTRHCTGSSTHSFQSEMRHMASRRRRRRNLCKNDRTEVERTAQHWKSSYHLHFIGYPLSNWHFSLAFDTSSPV